ERERRALALVIEAVADPPPVGADEEDRIPVRALELELRVEVRILHRVGHGGDGDADDLVGDRVERDPVELVLERPALRFTTANVLRQRHAMREKDGKGGWKNRPEMALNRGRRQRGGRGG